MSERKPSAGYQAGGSTGAGHESSDLAPRTIALFGLGLAVVVVASLILTAWLFDIFAARRATEDVPASPLARVEPPAGPLLQVDAPSDLARLRAEEEATLSTYGWVDRGKGIVRIPIQQAMRRLVEQGAKAPGRRAQ